MRAEASRARASLRGRLAGGKTVPVLGGLVLARLLGLLLLGAPAGLGLACALSRVLGGGFGLGRGRVQFQQRRAAHRFRRAGPVGQRFGTRRPFAELLARGADRALAVLTAMRLAFGTLGAFGAGTARAGGVKDRLAVQLAHGQAGLKFQPLAEIRRDIGGNLHESLVGLDADRADGVAGDVSGLADLGQQPARLGAAGMADRQQEPDRRPKFATLARGGGGDGRHAFGQFLGRGAAFAPQPDEGRGDPLGAEPFKQRGGLRGLVARRLVQGGRVQHPLVVARLHIVGRGRLAPVRDQFRALQQPLRLLVIGRGHDQHRGALGPRPPRPPRAVQQRFRVRRQIGMDHQLQSRQVDAACGHVGGDADAGAAIAQGLQRVAAFLLAEFARQRHDLEAAIAHPRQQVVHIGAGLAKDDGAARLIVTQGVEDGVLAVARRHRHGAVFDVAMLAGLAQGADAQGVALKVLGQRLDRRGHGGREHQRAAIRGRGAKDELQILAEAKVQHLVGLVQHAGAQGGKVKRAALDMVAQAARGADDDLGAAFQRAAFGPVIHTADAGGDLRAGLGVKPAQFARDLQGQFARRRDGQRQRQARLRQQRAVVQQVFGHGDAKGHRLARAGLRRHQQVAAPRLGGQHGLLHRGQAGIALGRQRRGQRRGNIVFVHFLRQKGDAGAHPGERRPSPFAAGPQMPAAPTVRSQRRSPILPAAQSQRKTGSQPAHGLSRRPRAPRCDGDRQTRDRCNPPTPAP